MNDRSTRRERLLILGTTPLSDEIVWQVERQRDRRHLLVGTLADENLAHLGAVIEQRRPHRILLALAERRGSLPIRELLDCYASRGIVVEDAAAFYERLTGRLALESMSPMSIIAGQRAASRLQPVFARLVSLAAASVCLVIFAPIIAVIAIAITCDSRGPVLFRQRRVGARGRPFTLLKFRTMQTGVRASEWEADNRDRVTRVGRLLRHVRLDELPQFINILRGEMNLIGPRPHPVSNLELFTLVARNLNDLTGVAISCYALRLMVPPGLTGWAQVRYRYANNLDEEIEKLRYDLYYIKHRSPWLDLRILLETVRVVVFPSRAVPPARPTEDRRIDTGLTPQPTRVSTDVSRLTT
jgi:lipopolysaccharide/colanic/teichoic acid biosynthesis glycosyltransferase